MRPTPRSRPSSTPADRRGRAGPRPRRGPPPTPPPVTADRCRHPSGDPAAPGVQTIGAMGSHQTTAAPATETRRRRRPAGCASTRDGPEHARLPAAVPRHLRRVRLVPDPPGVRDERPGDEPRVATRSSSASTTSRASSPTRCSASPSRNTALVRAPGARLRLPDPDHPRRADERGPPRPRPVQRPRLPAGRRPAGRRGPAVAVLLRRLADRACSTRSSAGSGIGPLPWLQDAGDGDAVDRHRGDLGRRRRRR